MDLTRGDFVYDTGLLDRRGIASLCRYVGRSGGQTVFVKEGLIFHKGWKLENQQASGMIAFRMTGPTTDWFTIETLLITHRRFNPESTDYFGYYPIQRIWEAYYPDNDQHDKLIHQVFIPEIAELILSFVDRKPFRRGDEVVLCPKAEDRVCIEDDGSMKLFIWVVQHITTHGNLSVERSKNYITSNVGCSFQKGTFSATKIQTDEKSKPEERIVPVDFVYKRINTYPKDTTAAIYNQPAKGYKRQRSS